MYSGDPQLIAGYRFAAREGTHPVFPHLASRVAIPGGRHGGGARSYLEGKFLRVGSLRTRRADPGGVPGAFRWATAPMGKTDRRSAVTHSNRHTTRIPQRTAYHLKSGRSDVRNTVLQS